MDKQFKVGVGKGIITPPLGSFLYGYPDKRPASEICDDLRVNAVAFQQGELAGIMISADICSISYDLTDEIRQLIFLETGVLPQNISISAIHTHSGPVVRTAPGFAPLDENYIKGILIPKTVAAAKSAFNSMMPAVMGIGTTESKVGINREQMFPNGHVGLGQNPYGPYDPTMTVLSFESTDGEPIVNLVHYGCHATSAGGGTEITRDWPGVMVDRMEEQTGAITIFFNGAEGDVGPRLSNGGTIGDMSHVREIGSVAAIDAVRAFRTIKEYREVKFKAVSDIITLPYKPLMSLEEAEAQQKNMGDFDKLKSGIARRRYNNLSEIIKIHKSGEPHKTHFEIKQTLFAFNSVVFVPFPFEMFSSITLRLRALSPFQHTLGTCNTNGSDYYLPSRDMICYEGYESYIFLYGTGYGYTLVNDSDNIIINENLRIMEKLCE